MTEQVRVMEADEVGRLIGRVDALEVMQRLFAALGNGRATQPPQTLARFPDGSGDFITYLGVLETARAFGAKLSPYINTASGPLITAWTTLMSMDTGRPLLLVDSARLTVERTAATSALAVRHLAPPRATRLAIIGTGPVARAHLRQVRAMREWSEIRLHSRSLMRALDSHDELHGLDPRVMLCGSVDDAVQDADVVMLCTSSAEPVLDPADLTTRALITSISTNAPRAHEVPPLSLHLMDIYCDDRLTTPFSAGEMVLAAEYGWSPADDVCGDLGELVTGRAPTPSPDTHTFFRSIGLGLEDVAMAAALLELAQRDATAS